ncbi:MAG TPA: MBL fold metallo-hydrolase [Bryobacteraceae bacterium]|nr:MBL fold metallo-hydrolase [Bryobacteraceae bacterium]
MTDSPRLAILDVGHGNSAVLHDQNGILIFDAGPGSTLNEYLIENQIREIAALLISHSDGDHLCGAINLLSSTDFRVKEIYLNPDPTNTGNTYRIFRSALRDAKENRGTRIVPHLTTDLSESFQAGATTVEILAPTPVTALGGTGGRDLAGKKITSNSMSAVVRLTVDSIPAVLLPGDMDADGLANLIRDRLALSARVLVFPHHGGLPGRADPAQFAHDLCSLVHPEMVVFSIGRGKHNTPNPAIAGAVLAHRPRPYIACTQLAVACAADEPSSQPVHLIGEVASGKRTRSCCMGTMILQLRKPTETFPVRRGHSGFVDRFAPTALCRRQ